MVVGFGFTRDHVTFVIDGLESNLTLLLHKKATSNPIQLNGLVQLGPTAWFHQMQVLLCDAGE